MRVVNDRDLVARASLTNPGLKHHVKATHLTYSTKQWFYTTFKQISWSTVPVLVSQFSERIFIGLPPSTQRQWTGPVPPISAWVSAHPRSLCR